MNSSSNDASTFRCFLRWFVVVIHFRKNAIIQDRINREDCIRNRGTSNDSLNSFAVSLCVWGFGRKPDRGEIFEPEFMYFVCVRVCLSFCNAMTRISI